MEDNKRDNVNNTFSETSENVVEEKSKKEAKAEKKAKLHALEEENIALKAEIEKWKNKYYTAYADTENLRKQYDAEQRDIRKYRGASFIAKLLPALDSFQVVLSQNVSDSVLKNYLTGFEYVHNQIVEAIVSEGVEVIAPKLGDNFDARSMHAMDTLVTKEFTPDTITKVYTNGYKLHDRLLRPAQVEVAVREKVENVVAKETTTVDDDPQKNHLN